MAKTSNIILKLFSQLFFKTCHVYRHHWLLFCTTFSDLVLVWESQDQCKAKPTGFNFLHTFHLIRMKFDVVMKHFKLNIYLKKTLSKIIETREITAVLLIRLAWILYLTVFVSKSVGSTDIQVFFLKIRTKSFQKVRTSRHEQMWVRCQPSLSLSVVVVIVRWHLYISSHFQGWSIWPVLIGQKRVLNQWTSTLHSKFHRS